MPEQTSDFTYDVFISYRHNDNMFDGWVSEFVTNLQKELRATIKHPVRIYFDKSPDERLGETHVVKDTIDEKLSTAIFIPIISQTYCDTSSYAWQHEFLAFKSAARQDQIGQNVRLLNGNTASRILPIKIHELEPDDVSLLESELSGFLRSINFIYSVDGVNRPLREQDDLLLSGKYTVLYRNQINLVANAIKDLLLAIRNNDNASEQPIISAVPEPTEVPEKSSTYIEDIPGIEERPVDQKVVYLAWTSSDLNNQRDEIALILEKAGYHVIPSMDCPSDENIFKKQCEQLIAEADFSLHLLSGEFGKRFEMEDEISFPKYQYQMAKKLADSNPDYNMFIWNLAHVSERIKPSQQEFINEIRQNISSNMMFSNSPNANQLIDDIRAATVTEKHTEMDTKETDIFFIYNENDEDEANDVTDVLSMTCPLEILNILSEKKEEYRELSKQQIVKSKLAVIYFKYTANWAVPFAKQIWKEIGGAESPTPLMLVGEDEPKTNLSRKFKAPKVYCTIVSKSVLSDEVLKLYKQLSNDLS